MNTNFDKNIQEILRSHTEQPSANCWDRVSSQLDALQTPNSDAGSSSSASQGGNASQFSQFVGSIAGKITSAVVATAVIGGIIALVVVNSTNNDTQAENEILIASEEIQNEISVFNEEEVIVNEIITTSKENENRVAEICFHSYVELENTNNLTENRNVQPINTVQNSVETSTVHSEPENATKTETSPKTNNKKRRPFFNNNNENTTVEDAEIPQEVKNLPKFTIPNIFTPNGYCFVIEEIEQFPENELYISDRNGNVVYKKINYKNDWGAENIPNGVYYYIFKYFYKGEQFMRNGSVTIKR